MKSMEKRVGIVGAGISGLLACKYAASKGFNPVVFEEQEKVGGVWNQTIESTRLQTPKESYQFLEYPWPSSAPMFPPNAQLVDYCNSYAHKFDLLPCINFNSKVLDIDYVGESEEEMQSWQMWGGLGKAFGSKGKWILRVFNTKDETIKEYEAEFVVLCIGRFSGLPNIPEFSPGCGPQLFSGKVLHSMEFSAMDNATAAELIQGKRIAIIGSAKSAMDIAFECANKNGKQNPCTVIRRTDHWMLPDVGNPWGISFGFLCFTRFFELMVHKPGEGFLSSALATLLSPLRWMASKFVESYVRWKFPLKKYDMIPKESFLGEASSCQIFFVPENFFEKVEDGSIALKKSKNFGFCKDGLIIDGESDPLKADIVILATGYKGDEKLKNMFASPTFQDFIAGSPTSIIPLYRQMIHPRIPQLAVIGYSESLANVHTFEIRCKWLAHFLDGAFELPNIKVMEKEIGTWEKYMKRYAGNGKFRRSCIGGIPIWYNDQLCRDIGCNPKRKKGFFAELFQPYGLPDYDGIAPGL